MAAVDKYANWRHVFQDAVEETADGEAFDCGGLPGVGVQIVGITSATVTFEATLDESTWHAVPAINRSTGAIATMATADGLYAVDTAGFGQVRCRMSAYVSGTITIVGMGMVNMNALIVSLGAGGVAIGDVDVTSLPTAVQGPGNPTIDSYNTVTVNLAASTGNQVLVAAPGANKQIWVYGFAVLANTAAGTLTLQDEDDVELWGVMALSDEGGFVVNPSGNFAMPWIKVATGKALEADTGACTVDGGICYAIVSV